jgi:hypothetical protein
MMSDEDLRDALQRLAPDVEESGVWEALHRKGGRNPAPPPLLASRGPDSAAIFRPAPPRKTRSRLRVVGLVAVGVIVVVGVGFSIESVVEQLRHRDRILVITDIVGPGGSGTSSSLAGVSPPTSTAGGKPPAGSSDVMRYGFDVRKPFIDQDATAALGDPAYKIVTTWVAIGNRLESPLSFALNDLKLVDAYDRLAYRDEHPDQYYYADTVAPMRTPALEAGLVSPGEIVGGYVSWRVPWYVWPQAVLYLFPDGVGGKQAGWQTPIFSDLNAGNPYYLAIGKLLYRGVVEGSEDEPFRPGDPITVAEFAKMAVLADAPYNQATFSYPAGYLKEATITGLATWGSMTANQTLTRLDVALTVARIGREELSAPPATYTLPFMDVPEDAKDDLALLAYNGVISGTTETSFDPTAECSRAQASQMLALVLDPRYREEQSRTRAFLPPESND